MKKDFAKHIVEHEGLNVKNLAYIVANYVPYTGANASIDLGIYNFSTTGDIAITDFTQGSVLYMGASGVISEDSDRLYFEDGNLAVGSNRGMRNILQAVKTESATDVTTVKALIAGRNYNTTNNNWTGFAMQTEDTAGTIYSGTRIMTQFTSHAEDAVSANMVFDTRNAGVRAERMRLTTTGLEMSAASILANATASGILTLGGTGGTNNENLSLDFESNADVVRISTSATKTKLFPTQPLKDITFFENASPTDCVPSGKIRIYYRDVDEEENILDFYIAEGGLALIEAQNDLGFSCGLGKKMAFDATGGAATIEFGSIEAQANPRLDLYGHLTAPNSGKRASVQVSDATDRLELTRQDANILGFDIQMPLITDDITASKYEIDSNTTYIDKDGSNNMTFTDAVTGTRTLKNIGCPSYVFLKAITQNEDTNIHLSDATNWAVSKVLIKSIRIITSSTDWDLYLLQNDNGYAADDANIPKLQVMEAGSGNALIFLDHAYDDEDDSTEVHIYFHDGSGANTFDIYVMGFELL